MEAASPLVAVPLSTRTLPVKEASSELPSEPSEMLVPPPMEMAASDVKSWLASE